MEYYGQFEVMKRLYAKSPSHMISELRQRMCQSFTAGHWQEYVFWRSNYDDMLDRYRNVSF